jgi:hypothetical protein
VVKIHRALDFGTDDGRPSRGSGFLKEGVLSFWVSVLDVRWVVFDGIGTHLKYHRAVDDSGRARETVRGQDIE